MKSNDSPEIPDRGETSDIPGLPSGVQLKGPVKQKYGWESEKAENCWENLWNEIQLKGP